MNVQAAITPDRGGRPPNIQRQARAMLRRHGAVWLKEAERQASLGDLSAMRLVVDLAVWNPNDEARQAPRPR